MDRSDCVEDGRQVIGETVVGEAPRGRDPVAVAAKHVEVNVARQRPDAGHRGRDRRHGGGRHGVAVTVTAVKGGRRNGGRRHGGLCHGGCRHGGPCHGGRHHCGCRHGGRCHGSRRDGHRGRDGKRDQDDVGRTATHVRLQ